jgi:excisionase family DNA binding protein
MSDYQHETIEWLTLAQVAKRLQLPTRAVSRLITSGRLPALHVSGPQKWRIRAVDVDRLASIVQKGKAEA